MLEILKFIFSDFWHWIGTVILVAVLASAWLFDVYLGNKNNKKIYDTQSYNSKAALGKAYCPGDKKYRKPYLEDKLPGAGPYTCKFHSR